MIQPLITHILEIPFKKLFRKLEEINEKIETKIVSKIQSYMKDNLWNSICSVLTICGLNLRNIAISYFVVDVLGFSKKLCSFYQRIQGFKLGKRRHDMLVALNSGDWDLFLKLVTKLVAIVGGTIGMIYILTLLVGKREKLSEIYLQKI